ncbi:MAG: HEAT repeat domain-containing protein [Elusimicrobiota bacterium]
MKTKFKSIAIFAGIVTLLTLNSAVFANDREDKLENDNWKIRANAIKGVAVSDIEDKVNFLRRFINDEDYRVRKAVTGELKIIGGEEVIPPLTEILNNDSNSGVRMEALKELISIGEPAVSSIGEALNDEDEKIRLKALKTILAMEQDIAVEYVPEAIEDPSPRLRELAINNLYNIALDISTGSVRNMLIKKLGKAIYDGKKSLRLLAIEKIADLGGDTAVETLKEGLKSEDRATKMKTVKAMGKIGTPNIVEPLANFISEEDFDIKMKGIEILGTIDSAKALEKITDFIGDDNYKIRKKIIAILSSRGDKTVVDNLKMVLKKDPSFRLRKNAVYALGSIGNKKSKKAIHIALEDSKKEVQQTGISLLGDIQSSVSVDALGKLFLEDRYFRVSISRAFKKIGDRRALQYLLEVLPQEKTEIKAAIEETVEYLIKVNK